MGNKVSMHRAGAGETLTIRFGWNQRAVWAVIIVASLVRAPFAFVRGYPFDQALFVAWSEISRPGSQIAPPGGMQTLYAPRPDGGGQGWSNYPPGYLLVLRGLAPVYDAFSPRGKSLDRETAFGVKHGRDDPAIRWAVALYKIPAMLADVMLAALLCVYVGRRLGPHPGWMVGLLYGLVPPFLFDSAVWGQVDSVFMLPIIIAVEAAARRRLALMAASAMIAALFKAQAAMFLPIFALVAVVIAGKSLRQWGRMIVAALLPTVLVLLPFAGSLGRVWEAYIGLAAFYPFTHLNGFSVWYLLNPLSEPHLETMAQSYVFDHQPILGALSARHIGFICVMSLWLVSAVRLWRRRCDMDSIAWAARILPLGFFVASTQMHERYLLPALVAWLWAYSPTRRWAASFATMTACATVNLWWFWPGYGMNHWTEACRSLLHRTWLGAQPGSWCALALIALALLVLFEPMRPLSRKSGPIMMHGARS